MAKKIFTVKFALATACIRSLSALLSGTATPPPRTEQRREAERKVRCSGKETRREEEEGEGFPALERLQEGTPVLVGGKRRTVT